MDIQFIFIECDFSGGTGKDGKDRKMWKNSRRGGGGRITRPAGCFELENGELRCISSAGTH